MLSTGEVRVSDQDQYLKKQLHIYSTILVSFVHLQGMGLKFATLECNKITKIKYFVLCLY